MNTYLFDFICRGLVDADSAEEAVEALKKISINSDAGDYDIYVDEVADVQVEDMRKLKP